MANEDPVVRGRWVYKTSPAWRFFEIAFPPIFVGAGMLIIRAGSPLFFVGAAVCGLTISIFGLLRGSDYQLVVEERRIRWGWVARARNDLAVDLARVTLVLFRRRNDGRGTIELNVERGGRLLLPTMITESTDSADAIVALLSEQLGAEKIKIV